ncbi:MAG: hypothetical protein KAT34_04855 [Candidatus Aminicenantes bacterium]|nr:hypothetical protein [Candidatus Aminicenantes bacterium]
MSTKRQKTTRNEKVNQSKYDSAWKKVIEKLFKDFLEFFFPDIYQAIDFTKEIHFLDKELQEIAPDSNMGDRAADVLVKVHLKNGSMTYICIIIHIEVQSQAKPGFMERMFVYFYRGYDKKVEKNIPMISVAILADDNPNYRPDEYYFSLFGFEMRMKIPVVKILDYNVKKELRERLESTTNPMSMIVKAQLKSHEVKKADNDTKFEVTKELIRQCYKHGYSKEETHLVMNFFDWVIRLPESYKDRLKEVIRKIEEEFKMEYIPLWERDARKEGRKEGQKEGQKKGKIETAKQMLLDNIPIKKVVKYTGLTEKEVKALMH